MTDPYWQGEPGQPGQPGETTAAGRGGAGGRGGHGGSAATAMTRGTLHATLFLFVFTLVLFAANLLFTAHEVGNVRAVAAAAGRNTASIVQLCETGNEFRAQQVVLWEHIITISRPPPHETPPEARKRLAGVRAFDAYIRKVFAPRNCHAIPR